MVNHASTVIKLPNRKARPARSEQVGDRQLSRSQIPTGSLLDKDPKSLAWVRRAYEAMGDAASMLRVAQKAFGDGGDQEINLADVRKVVLAAKASMHRALESLGAGENTPDALDGFATKLLFRLYDTWDITTVLLAALNQQTAPDGAGMTECPLAGTLSVICGRLEQDCEGLKEVSHG